jgi:hypothetical protein
MSAKSFWPTRALLKTAGFGETTEITEITVSTFGVVSDLGGLPASGPGEIREWRAGATTPLEDASPWIGWVEFSKNAKPRAAELRINIHVYTTGMGGQFQEWLQFWEKGDVRKPTAEGAKVRRGNAGRRRGGGDEWNADQMQK